MHPLYNVSTHSESLIYWCHTKSQCVLLAINLSFRSWVVAICIFTLCCCDAIPLLWLAKVAPWGKYDMSHIILLPCRSIIWLISPSSYLGYKPMEILYTYCHSRMTIPWNIMNSLSCIVTRAKAMNELVCMLAVTFNLIVSIQLSIRSLAIKLVVHSQDRMHLVIIGWSSALNHFLIPESDRLCFNTNFIFSKASTSILQSTDITTLPLNTAHIKMCMCNWLRQ